MAIRLKRATHLKGATGLKRVMHASRLYSRPQIVFNLILEKVACVLLLLRWVYWAPLYHLLEWGVGPQVELQV